MNAQLDLTFHGMEPSEAIKDRVQERVERLDHFERRISKCRVVVDSPHQSARKGRLYRVHLDVHVPGAVLAVHRGEGDRPGHDTIEEALDDAFNAGERLLRDRHERRTDHHRGRGSSDA